MIMNKLYVVMPAYNEAGIIEKVVQEWYAVVRFCRPTAANLSYSTTAFTDGDVCHSGEHPNEPIRT